MSKALLEGVRVLDLSRVLAGPWAAMTLGDLGADVVKVEQPGKGDDTRGWGPPFAENGMSAYYLCANRNKRGIALDLKAAAGREVLAQLIERADVLIENFRAGGLVRLGFDEERLRALRPGLIYCTVTGFGYDNPHSSEAGYDFMIQARSGLMSVTGEERGEPTKVGVAVCDLQAGLNAANGILAALYANERARARGEAAMFQRIDVALFDSAVAMLANQASHFLVSGEAPRALGNAHPHIVPYQAFEASDGRFALAVGNDSQWRKLCDALKHTEWAGPDAFETNAQRVAGREQLVPAIEELTKKRSVQDWLKVCDEIGIPAAPIQNLSEAFEDPRAVARGLQQQIDGLPLVASPLRIPTAPVTIRRAPPKLGEHQAEVLEDWLDQSE